FGSFPVDGNASVVPGDAQPVCLTGRQYQLLRYFIDRAGSTIPRKELLQSVWGYEADTLTRTVDTHVASLRRKLEENPKRRELFLTVAGVGYKFVGHSPQLESR